MSNLPIYKKMPLAVLIAVLLRSGAVVAICATTVGRVPAVDDYPWRCSCGDPAFVDLGKDYENRYPCRLCYLTLRKPMGYETKRLQEERHNRGRVD